MPEPLTAADQAKIVAALNRGDKIRAIAAYRAATGCSLLEAKTAVEGFPIAGFAAAPVASTGDAVAAVEQALFAGKLIAAIKIYRDVHHVDLKTAKDAVEAIQVELRRTSPDRFTVPPRGSGGCGLLLLIAGLIAAAAVAFWIEKG